MRVRNLRRWRLPSYLSSEESSLGLQSGLLKLRARQLFPQQRSFRPRSRPGSDKNLFTPPPENVLQPAVLHPQNISPPAPVDTTTKVVEILVSITCITLPPAFKISDSENIEYRAHVFHADHFAQAACPTNADRVEELRTTVCESRWASGLGSFLVAKKNPPLHRFSVSLLSQACDAALLRLWLPSPRN